MDVVGDLAKDIFVQGIPGVTQIDGDLLEPSLLRGSWGSFLQGGGAGLAVRGGEGCSRTDRRQRRREGRSRSLKTSHQHAFKNDIGSLSSGAGRRTETSSLYSTCTHPHWGTNTHTLTHTLKYIRIVQWFY